MKNIWIHLLTGIDGETFAIARVLWVISTVIFLALTIYQVVNTGVFDYSDWGIALAAVLAGGGIGVKTTESTEPPAP